MATFRLVDPADLDATQAQFAFEVSGENTYLKFGLLNDDDTDLFESIIAGGYVGFFSSGEEIGKARITLDYDAENGVGVAGIPPLLEVGSAYVIRWTQARPGRASEAIRVNVLGGEQGVVRFSVPANLELGVEARMHFDYKVIDASYESFLLRFYPSANDYDTRRPIPVGDEKYPENIRIVPENPFTTPGDYIHELYFTPTYVGDIFISLDLIEREASDIDLFRLIDIDGNRLIDIDGNILVGQASPMFQLSDIDGNVLVDIDGNKLIGFL